MPKVSVIILAWNCGDYLLESVGSILDQTMSDLEVVLVDNASTDGSVERLLAARPDPRIRLLRQERNLGIAGGNNLALRHCRSPWVAIMDGDDRAHPARLELAMRAADACPDLDVISTGVVRIDAAGRRQEPFWALHEPHEIAAYVRYHMPICHPSVHARREVYARVHYREAARLCADYDWLGRVVDAGFRVGSVSLPLLEYRRHVKSTTIARHAESEAHVSAIRLAHWRRLAGRAEEFETLCAEAAAVAAGPDPLRRAYRHFGRRAAADGLFVLAAFHAALASRVGHAAADYLRFYGYLLRALGADRRAWGEAILGAGKGPFWTMLKRSGFPPFPRY